MVEDANSAIQGNDKANYEEGESDDAKRLLPSQADRDDTGSELPCRRVEGIGNPVRNKGGDTPFAA